MTDISSYDRWHLNGFNLCEVIVIHDGPDALGHDHVDGRHQHSIAIFDTVEQAREAVKRHNAPPQNLAREGEGASGSEVRATTNLRDFPTGEPE